VNFFPNDPVTTCYLLQPGQKQKGKTRKNKEFVCGDRPPPLPMAERGRGRKEPHPSVRFLREKARERKKK
jgi:hypothetical protein